MIHIGSTYKSDSGLKKPTISGEEDRPFPSRQTGNSDAGAPVPQDVPTLMKLNEQKHSHQVDTYKNIVGGILLTVCILIIVSFAIGDAIFEIDSTLFSGAFEFAKTIATAVIGYLFATNTKEKQ